MPSTDIWPASPAGGPGLTTSTTAVAPNLRGAAPVPDRRHGTRAVATSRRPRRTRARLAGRRARAYTLYDRSRAQSSGRCAGSRPSACGSESGLAVRRSRSALIWGVAPGPARLVATATRKGTVLRVYDRRRQRAGNGAGRPRPGPRPRAAPNPYIYSVILTFR